jgi:hypothetical protein
MIPEFITSIDDRERKQKAKIERLQKLKSMNFAPSDEIHQQVQIFDMGLIHKSGGKKSPSSLFRRKLATNKKIKTH